MEGKNSNPPEGPPETRGSVFQQRSKEKGGNAKKKAVLRGKKKKRPKRAFWWCQPFGVWQGRGRDFQGDSGGKGLGGDNQGENAKAWVSSSSPEDHQKDALLPENVKHREKTAVRKKLKNDAVLFNRSQKRKEATKGGQAVKFCDRARGGQKNENPRRARRSEESVDCFLREVKEKKKKEGGSVEFMNQNLSVMGGRGGGIFSSGSRGRIKKKGETKRSADETNLSENETEDLKNKEQSLRGFLSSLKEFGGGVQGGHQGEGGPKDPKTQMSEEGDFLPVKGGRGSFKLD